jgi:succinyl-CoA synthetase beta subunit
VKIHEYQAKRLLKGHGIPVPRGAVAFTAAEAQAAARFLGGERWMVKAQIHAGGRGHAGGVRLVDSLAAIEATAQEMLGKPLVTRQTGPQGLMVRRVYVEEALNPARELYLAVYVDRATARVTILGSPDGGMKIEDDAVRRPGAVVKLPVDPVEGVKLADARTLATRIGAGAEAAPMVAEIAAALYRAFLAFDASLIEINPLALLENGRPMALDARLVLDDNALFRHPDLAALRDDDESTAAELEAARHEINFVAMTGNVGCVVNGAGLGMATLDLLKLRGVEPANFMDIRPVATREQIARGFRMMLGTPNLRCILVNIFGGGIMRCDLVAEGMVLAAREVPVRVPLVVRFAGTNAELGRKHLGNASLKAEFASSLADAAARVARITGDGGGASTRSRAVAHRA